MKKAREEGRQGRKAREGMDLMKLRWPGEGYVSLRKGSEDLPVMGIA